MVDEILSLLIGKKIKLFVDTPQNTLKFEGLLLSVDANFLKIKDKFLGELILAKNTVRQVTEVLE